MSWWWNKLITIHDGPALMLLQNTILYWLGWGLVAMGMRRHVGRGAYLIPLVGLFPGLLFPLGVVWKDVFFACLMFAAFGIVFNAQGSQRRLMWLERFSVVVLATFAIGVKSNGVTAVPFLMGYWLYVDHLLHGRWVRHGLVAVLLTVACAGMGALAVSTAKITNEPNTQGIFAYDLVGISVRSGQMLLPPFLSAALGSDVEGLATYYIPERANPIYWNDEGVWYPGVYTRDPAQLSDLSRHWIDAILSHPLEYLEHRLDHFAAAMRWGGRGPAYVAVATIDPNEFGLKSTPNGVSDFLTSTWWQYPWMYLPWVYAYVLVLSTGALLVMRRHIAFAIALGGSAVAFVAPQFFVVPADDYRYFYYAYICSAVLAIVAVLELARVVRANLHTPPTLRAWLHHERTVLRGLFLLWRDNGIPRQAPTEDPDNRSNARLTGEGTPSSTTDRGHEDRCQGSPLSTWAVARVSAP